MSVVVVSWILTLLAVFGLTYSYEVRGEAELIQVEVERQELRAWANSGVQLALAELDNLAIDREDTGREAVSRSLFEQPRMCGEGFFSVGEFVASGDAEIWVPGIVDETGRLPIAVADSVGLAALPGMTRRGARAILRARARAGNTHIPPFEMLEGLDDLSLACANRYVSRWGQSVNVNSASLEVLRAVGLPDRAARKMLDWRAGSDGVTGTADDEKFQSLEGHDPGLARCHFSSDEAAILAFLAQTKRLSVDSSHYSLYSRGWGPNARGICEIHVVLEKAEGKPARIVEMNENWLN